MLSLFHEREFLASIGEARIALPRDFAFIVFHLPFHLWCKTGEEQSNGFELSSVLALCCNNS